MDEVYFDIYGNCNKIQDNSPFDGERIATVKSIISLYERRIKRFQEEDQLLKDLIEFQYKLINKLGITPENMIPSPGENQQDANDKPSDNSDEYTDDEDEENDSEENEARKKTTTPTGEKEKYLSIKTEFFLNYFKKKIEKQKNAKQKNRQLIHDIFQKFPIVESTFYEKDFKYNMDEICEYVQTLSIDKRQEFYSEIFSSLNNIPFILNCFFSLLHSKSFHALTESIELAFRSLNYSHSQLYFYDFDRSLLLMDKQKVKISHVLNDGLISNAIKNNQPIFISRNNPKIKEDDLNILAKQQKGLFVPIHEISAVLAFFNKIEKFTPIDDLTAQASSSFIAEIGCAIQLRSQMNARLASFKKIEEIFINLSSLFNFDTLLNKMTKLLAKIFNCSQTRLYKVSTATQSFWKLSTKKNSGNNSFSLLKKPDSFPFGHGIVGLSIKKKSPISVPRTEFSILFESDSDRPESDISVNSILSCPVFNAKGEVKWSVVLSNKLNHDSFSEEDVLEIEEMSRFFNTILSSAMKTSILLDEVNASNSSTEDTNQIIEFISSLSNLNSMSEISSKLTLKMNRLAKTERTEIFTIDQKSNLMIGENEGEIFSSQIKPDSEDPIIKFSLSNQIKETRFDPSNSSRVKVFCPLNGANKKVVGMMVLTSFDNKQSDDASSMQQSSRQCFFYQSNLSLASSRSISSSQQSRLQKKLEILSQKSQATFTSLSNPRAQKVFSMLGKIGGELAEVVETNKKVKELILIEERLLDCLKTLDDHTISYLYPQIGMNFTWRKSDKFSEVSNETVPLVSFEFDENLSSNYAKFLRVLNQFDGHCKLLKMKTAAKSVCNTSNNNLRKSFPLTNSFDVFNCSEQQIFSMLPVLMHDLDIVTYLRFDQMQLQSCLEFIRRNHVSKPFSNWQLSVDRVQFLSYFLKHTQLDKSLSKCQKAALFLYLISMNCDTYAIDASSSKSRFFLESGHLINVGSTVFSILSSVHDSPFFSIEKEELSLFFKTIESIDQINEVDSSLSGDLVVLVALISSFSYLARDTETTRNWVKLRFDEEFGDEKPDFLADIIKYQLEFDMRILIQQAFAELAKNKISKIDEVRQIFIESLSKITSFNF